LDNLGYNNTPPEILPPSVNAQDYVPFQNFARNSTYETTNGNSSYNSLQTTYEHQLAQGLSLLANYTFSKCMSDQHTQASQNPQYRAEWLSGFGIQADYAPCDIDATHLAHVSGEYALPFGTGRTFLSGANKLVDGVLGGWAVNFIYSYQSGQPFNLGCPVATSSDYSCNADVVPGVDMYAGPNNHKQWLNPAAFAQPALATSIGETDYSVLGGRPMQARGPSFSNIDASIFKNFQMTESVRLQFRAEAFNLTNTPQFGQPGSNNLNFTDVTGGFSSITTTRNNQRLLQLALKLFY
jgi:hypothetical protein